MNCPSCGKAATGKFCSACGATLAGANCPNCKSALTPGARFCHLCGTPLGAPRVGGKLLIPWAVAAAAVLGLVAVVVFQRPGAETPSTQVPGGTVVAPFASGGSGAPAPDISNMSPRERADRLFNRIMSAAERGDTTEVRFFRPMGLQAYAMLGPLDPDARYHVALIQIIAGDVGAARAQADSIERALSTHLFAPIVRAELARLANDQPARVRSYRDFMSRYEREIASGRQEYGEHRQTLDAFREEARKAVGGAAPAPAPRSP